LRALGFRVEGITSSLYECGTQIQFWFSYMRF